MSARDFEICDCECHTDPSVVHIMPCCEKCPHCGGNIVIAFYDEHVAKCTRKPTQEQKNSIIPDKGEPPFPD